MTVTSSDGRFASGSVLHVVPSRWVIGVRFDYEWTINGRVVSTQDSYIPDDADIGQTVSVKLTGHLAGWADGTATATVLVKTRPGQDRPTLTPTPSVTVSQPQLPSSAVSTPSKPGSTTTRPGITASSPGQAVKIPVAAYRADGSTESVAFVSNNPKTVKVSKSGWVKARRVGQAKITVRAANGVKTSIRVKVVSAKSKAKVKRVKVAGVSKRQLVGRVSWANVKYTPTGRTGVKVKYSSNRPDILTVDKTGRVQAKTPGRAVLTVKAGGKTKKLTINVN